MKIMINGVDADIRTENEKTLGEVLSVLDGWLCGSGYRLSGLNVNGETINAGSVESFFYRDIDTVETLDISASSLPQLLAESYLNLIQDIDEYETLNIDDKPMFIENWKESPQAGMLSEQSPDIYNLAVKTFSGEFIGNSLPSELPESSDPPLRLFALERFRELQDPVSEFKRIESLVLNVCLKLEEIPLDFQTGKDASAMEKINCFSGIAEKIFRIISILKLGSYPINEITVNDMPLGAYINEFDAALREMLAANERSDTILVGDIAEYEMAPRLRGLYASIFDYIKGE